MDRNKYYSHMNESSMELVYQSLRTKVNLGNFFMAEGLTKTGVDFTMASQLTILR
jgi:hypothetical protein